MERTNVRDGISAGGDGGEAIEEDDDPEEGDGEEPSGVESNPREVDPNLLTKVASGTDKNHVILQSTTVLPISNLSCNCLDQDVTLAKNVWEKAVLLGPRLGPRARLGVHLSPFSALKLQPSVANQHCV